ncbi:hypothetical protein Pth03_27810 [Planotetraspora thailandica]|uniref:4-oxalocrotonate tautomerase-like domain-containing protein n=1 Tax=Planotetraspora thailandica TaxID=487172 RepID=A0A8J3UZE1_9ACTN|nr:tautomerase family protein [Planotetraspora thailandica]GII54392.1 hypothetical protein Pth03_27810 [Planotetraspora thailandica]
MPHVSIKHFPADLTKEQETALVGALTEAVRMAFGCDEGVISIALEPVDPGAWQERVYQPEIIERRHLLRKQPAY